MPEYEFVNVGGQHRLEFYKMKDAPKCGEWVLIDGERWQRIPSRIGATVEPEVRIECLSAPLNDPEVRKAGGSYNEHGEAMFSSARQRDEYAARKGITYER